MKGNVTCAHGFFDFNFDLIYNRKNAHRQLNTSQPHICEFMTHESDEKRAAAGCLCKRVELLRHLAHVYSQKSVKCPSIAITFIVLLWQFFSPSPFAAQSSSSIFSQFVSIACSPLPDTVNLIHSIDPSFLLLVSKFIEPLLSNIVHLSIHSVLAAAHRILAGTLVHHDRIYA